MPNVTKTMVLTAGSAGKTGVLNGHRFVKGFCEVTLPENEMDGCLKYFKRCYKVDVVDGRIDPADYVAPKTPAPIVEAVKEVSTVREPTGAVDIEPVVTESEGVDNGTIQTDESPKTGGSSEDEANGNDTSDESDQGEFDTV